jgi:peptidyl-prolyl cis-trans isomerase D
MAIINRLRSSKWVFALVLVSLALFVASDYFTNSNKYNTGGDKAIVGEIDGEEITQVDFDSRYKAMLQQSGQEINDQTREQASTYAWNQLIQELIVNKEYEKIGITITEAEASQLLYSNNPHRLILQYFTSEDGQFTPQNVISFKKNAKNSPKAMEGWNVLLNQISLDVKSEKYNAILKNTYYATSLDVEDEYFKNQKMRNGTSVSINYASIDDNTIKLTDDELKEYIKNHSEEFQQKASRNLDYVLFDIRATPEDSITIKNEVKSEINAFKSAENDSLYISLSGSEVPFDTLYKSRGNFDPAFENKLFNASIDSILGPIAYKGGYSLFKVVDKKRDSLAQYHIIRADIPVRGVTKMDTTEATLNGKKIIAEAAAFSDKLEFYNSKTSTGELSSAQDMNWMKMGSGIPEIEKAAKSLSPGQSTVVQSVYGLSILTMVEPKSYDQIQVAEFRKSVVPLKATTDAVYQQAIAFRSSLIPGDEKSFENSVTKQKLVKSVANDIRENDKLMTGLPNTKELVRWAYGEKTELGDYSDIIDCNDFYIVATLSKIRKEGTSDLEDVREKATRLAMNDKKAQQIKAQFDEALKSSKNIQDLAVKLKSVAQPFNNINFNSGSIPLAGNDPVLVGYVCGLKEKTMSQPIITKEGVSVIFVESTIAPQMAEDISSDKMMMYSQEKNQIYSTMLEILKKVKNVKDNRNKYY